MWSVDLADLDGVTAFAERADDELGGIDLLVNNAGIPKRKMATALRLDEVDDTMAINYLSPVRLTLALLPRMIAREQGAIVFLGSVAARLSPPGETAYSATTAAMTAFAEGLAIELWDSPLSVHVIHPGIIATELFSLPDNDESFADDIEPMAPSAVYGKMIPLLDDGTVEGFVPEWFGDVESSKAADLQDFLAGSAAYFAAKRAET
jgi:NAD(P)-dependent dehydrogenase (short-subunit alcohol dehydrogenase family)